MSAPVIFDTKRIELLGMRARRDFNKYSFLRDFALKVINERMEIITRDFEKTAELESVLPSRYLGEEIEIKRETLPFTEPSLDKIQSVLHLHCVNDLPGMLTQIRRALKPDGLFIGAMFGGDTLHELRESLRETEIAGRGGLSPRVHPFAGKQDIAALMQRAGFALPVVDSETVTVTYDSMFKLIADLRGMGESNVLIDRDKTYVGREFFIKNAQNYHRKFAEDDGRIPATFEILFMIGWAPHDSQQKPAVRGSGQVNLNDVL